MTTFEELLGQEGNRLEQLEELKASITPQKQLVLRMLIRCRWWLQSDFNLRMRLQINRTSCLWDFLLIVLVSILLVLKSHCYNWITKLAWKSNSWIHSSEVYGLGWGTQGLICGFSPLLCSLERYGLDRRTWCLMSRCTSVWLVLWSV